MFGLFKSNPKKKLQKKISSKLEAAMQLQRNGKLRESADLMKEVEIMERNFKVARAIEKFSRITLIAYICTFPICYFVVCTTLS